MDHPHQPSIRSSLSIARAAPGMRDADKQEWSVRINTHRLMRPVVLACLHKDSLIARHRLEVKPGGVCCREMCRVDPATFRPV